MIRISILYAAGDGSRFDFDYYTQTHMPLSIQLLSTHPGFKGVSVERVLGGPEPGSAPTYVAMCYFLFTSLEDFLAAFGPHAAILQGDMANYTNIVPLIQVSEVMIAR